MGLTNFKISEPWMTKMLEVLTLEKSEGAYFDVGVNIGQTLVKLKSVNTSINYYGFEPNPTCIFYSKKLIELNNFQNVTLFPCGISNSNSLYELSFYSSDDTDSAASMITNFRPNQIIFKKEYIPCYNVAQVFLGINVPKVAILKIDVEGGELEVLEGMERIIESDKPFIQIEILPVYSNENENRLERQNKIESLLKKWDYVIFRILVNSDNEIDKVQLIETIGIHSDMKWCEYLFVAKNQMVRIESLFNCDQH